MMTGTAIAIYNHYIFWVFLPNEQVSTVSSSDLFLFSFLTACAFWNIVGHELLVPQFVTSLFLFFFSHLKHLDLIPKCGYLHTAGQGLPCLGR